MNFQAIESHIVATLALFCLLFATQTHSAPPETRILKPEGPSADSAPPFVWIPATEAVRYRLEVRDVVNSVIYKRWLSAGKAGCGHQQGRCRASIAKDWPRGSYRWRLQAEDAQGDRSGWSQWLTFYTGQSTPPTAPNSPEPVAPKAMADSYHPVFQWQRLDDVTRYRIQARDKDGTLLLNRWSSAKAANCTGSETLCSLESPVSFEENQYRWRILAKNQLSNQPSRWSDWLSFETPGIVELGSGLDERPSSDSCSLPLAPPLNSGVAPLQQFTGLSFKGTVSIIHEPNGTRWFTIEQPGRIRSFDPTDNTGKPLATVLDISQRVSADTGETGLLGMALHPQFPSIPYAYVFYTDYVNGKYRSHLAEFSSLDGGMTLEPDSERRLLSVTGHEDHHHKGGTVAFGPQGYLYLGLGDGGTLIESQDPHNFLGAMLRIDVDSGDPYAIPDDNPFADGVNGAPEVYAYGFRNPWRWSIEASTGKIWLTDVGSSDWEEINIVKPGRNYGWPLMEGPDCDASESCPENLQLPLHAYPHDATGGIVIVGGIVYRGNSLPQLKNRFVFADGTDRVWVLGEDEYGNTVRDLIIDGQMEGGTLRSLFEAPDGEIYIVKSNVVYKLTASSEDKSKAAIPQKLSDTGCVASADPTKMAKGLMPYKVNSAFWTDGADKKRWLRLPQNSEIELAADGDFLFPIGTVLVKEFSLAGKRVETRLLVRHDDGRWAGYSYAWNARETEATLVEREGREISVEGQPYSIPGQSQCMICHTQAAGHVLGLEIPQLNRDMTYPSTGRRANQLTTLSLLGMLKDPLPDSPDALHAFAALDDAGAPIADRTLAYLHANCSSCHRPDGGGRGPADLRYGPLVGMKICNRRPEVEDLGIDNAFLLAPGDPARSILAVRMNTLGSKAMPPIGKHVVDYHAVDLLERFIESVDSCNPGSP